ncbi:DHH family phosphoesterase [Natronobacterium gregoryi]|uniref:Phosphoesterase RecJ domain-containing protein n=2 Tax=Natronobacterium gregoryi TaxID=44930 RepID=L0AF53_NATGS|nr:OB-fold nucleic acid binding domain-containing protein [Natronobacterium gregoryi]AFZ71675.1 RecJ-like exonuclease with DnaJ-type Zn-finger domain [Natronobacterium gregoryi SP2]ELY72753.1 phosphoesterase RecJ domain-containing protein [Natronobacterium gregoryi SP2]PLK20277.1 RecJ like exonuclease [Natronobacterium gregoryi SP2]SFJ24795.1 RecJ-like exonuclease [Natronobacterium gregoryi]
MKRASAGDAGTDDGDSVVYDLDADCTAADIESDTPYLAEINGIVDYGVFVDLSESVSGLVHESVLEGTFAVGDELVVELESVRDNGDIAFEPVDVDDYTLQSVSHDYALTGTDRLEANVGDQIHLEGEVVQVKQTGGPTIFHVADESGVVPCAAFEEAGVRAYPNVEVGDVVRVTGSPEHREGSVQIEVDGLSKLEAEDAEKARERIQTALESRSEPHDVDPLIDWPAFEKLRPNLQEVATRLRRAVLEGRPIRVRHHADGDGMCAAVPVQIALEKFIAEVHENDDAPRHLIKRLPAKAPFYEMEDATRDLNFALEDREKHGQQLPLLLMLDNGSTAEDVPAYETLAHYDIPIIAIDHHHPDPDAVEDLLDAHVNPYLHDEDYRITTGMLCVELARMIYPDLTDQLRHVPAVAGLSDRSKADAMDQYLELAAEEGYDEQRLQDVSEALDYAAFWLRYDSGDQLIQDLLQIDNGDEQRHRDLVDFFADRAREEVDEQLDAAIPHLEHEDLDNGAHLYRIDVENHAHRFTYPAPGKTTGEIHDRKIEETGDPVITVGYGPDFAVLRSDGVRLDIPQMVSELEDEVPGGGVSGGGHLVVGSIKFVKGKREEVIDALVEKMEDAEIDEALSSAAPIDD